MKESKIDKTCIPFPRKNMYWLINLPYLILLISTFFYLLNHNMTVSFIFIAFYFLAIILHGYVCSFSECPYKGTLCPGAFAWFPVGKVAILFNKMKMKKSYSLINLFFLIIMIAQTGILVLPLYWISQLGVLYNIGYIVIILLHFFFFVLVICAKCAQKYICPTAKLSIKLNKLIFRKDILNH